MRTQSGQKVVAVHNRVYERVDNPAKHQLLSYKKHDQFFFYFFLIHFNLTIT